MRKMVLPVVFAVLFIGGTAFVVFTERNKTEVAVEEPQSVLNEKKVTQIDRQYPAYVGQSLSFIASEIDKNRFPAEIVERYIGKLEKLAIALKDDPYDFDDWMAVGIYKKFFDNYIGARDAWEYAKILVPAQPQSYLNLANLYAYYLKDLKSAEDNYLAAVNLDQNNVNGSYNVLAGFYRDFNLKDRALEYYRKILAMNPDDAAVKTEIQRLENNQP